MNREESQYISYAVSKLIMRRAPFNTSKDAVTTFIGFMPKCHAEAYEYNRMGYLDTFLKEYICGLIARSANPAIKGMTRVIRKNSLFETVNSLRTNEFALHFQDRDELLDIIEGAREDFMTTLEEVARHHADAKMILITVICWRSVGDPFSIQ